MKIADVEVRLVCRPCFRGKHGQCDRVASYLPAAGGRVDTSCECSVQR